MAAQRIVRLALAAFLVAALGAALSACVPEPTGNPSNSPRPTDSRTPTPTPTKVPTIVTGGTAEDNLPYFDHINQQTFAAVGFVEGKPYIDALTAAGFDRASMELTWWDTPDGHYADSVFFSVRLGDQCMIGQIAAWGYTSEVLPVLPTGSCMIGDYLQPIDW